MTGKALAISILSLLTGIIFGAILYSHYYHVSEKILEKYDLFFMFFPTVAMFLVGIFVGRSGGKKKGYEYKPLFQGRPQQLGQDGERLVMASLRRIGLVREEERRRG